ncbi:uncharacterized protein LOC121518360 [Cheilinus undulatus]|uniref:uncharacterized protein LOC121518360 n=1 Tax=Cheilinus undulatus TaxID=241271 RepID=UPI001BD34D0E|nr:uncharacterized protein LOC121518360 [Cheilinus undulatus]
MERHKNKRGFKYHAAKGRHLKLNDLRIEARARGNNYLFKENIPDYPRPEFHVCRLRHDTDIDGLEGIRGDGGFTNPWLKGLLWWSLDVGPEEIVSAERRLLETTYPDRTEEQIQKQQSLLSKFASSPVFQSSSRLGPFRFTLTVEEIMRAYKEQFCGGAEPIMRVFQTHLYDQEVMYAVLVHSPGILEQLQYPLLTDDPDSVCCYRDGYFLWRSEAMCGKHSFELVHNDDLQQMEVNRGRGLSYVWDNVAIAFHVDNKVLKFDVDRLRKSLKFCEVKGVTIDRSTPFHDYEKADRIVRSLWPDYPAALERAGEQREDANEGHEEEGGAGGDLSDQLASLGLGSS